jgi:nitrate reductase gamma subunit
MFVPFVEGLFWNVAVAVFVVGVIWRLFSILRAGIKADLAVPRASGLTGAMTTNIRRFFPRKEVAPRIRIHVIAGYMFHLGLFALLVFAAPHVRFIENHILGFGWTPMPYWAFIVAAEIAFAGLLLLLLHRLLHPVTRLLSTADDYIASILTFIVMLTGCMALLESYAGLRAFHLFTVELLMIYFPFSRLMHAFTFVFSRSYTGSQLARHGVDA